MIDLTKRLALFTAALAALTALGCASAQKAETQAIDLAAGELNTATLNAGLREALAVATDRTVARLTKEDGYIGNPDIRIRMPQQWASAVRSLKRVGLGSYVDEIEVAMNRAAEQAVFEAGGIFRSAIGDLTIKDARKILDGDDTAATSYLRRHAVKELRARYGPVVEAKMDDQGLANAYDKARERYQGLPMTQHIPTVDLNQYVIEAALAGLFVVIAQEEQRIRREPAARTTALLRRVFENP